MTTRPQTWQIVNQEPLEVLETQTREPLHNLNKILDSKLDYPFRLELSGSTITINSSEIQTIKSDGSGGLENSYRIAPSPILGKYKNIVLSTLDLATGSASGVFDSTSLATAPVLSANEYIYLGIELRLDGKYYLVWGNKSGLLSIASRLENLPIFTTGDAVCLIQLRNNGSPGQWNFNTPSPTEIVIFKESNQLEIREDVVHKVRVVDLVTKQLPTVSSPILDGITINTNDVVLFTFQGEGLLPSIEGLYRFDPNLNSFWEKILAPKNGTNIQVIDGTSYFRTIWKRVEGIWRPIEVADAVKEPSGFPNRVDSTFSFDDSSRTFTIEPAVSGGHFDYFQRGIVRRKDSPTTIQIPDTEGIHFIYFDGENLNTTTSFNEYILREAAYISTVSWDAENNTAILLADERHGITMDGATHKYLHLSVGTVLQSGLGITATGHIGGSGTLDVEAQFSLADGRLFDEDIDFSIRNSASPSLFFEQELSPIAKIPLFYKSGADFEQQWRKLSATEFAFHTEERSSVSSVQYNIQDGGSGWVLDHVAEEGATGYVSTWVFATNSVIEPVIGIIGQNKYTVLSEAQENEQYAFLNTAGLPVIEFKLLFRIIWEVSSTFANTPKARIADIQDLRVSPDSPFPSVSPNDHGLLSGLGDPDHPPRAVTTFGVVKDGGLSDSDGDLADTLDTLNKLLGQLRLKEHPTNKKRVILTGANRIINSGLNLGQELNNLLISFEGAEIDFISGIVYKADGSTNLGLSFVPKVVPDSHYHWYSINLVGASVNVDATLGTQVLVIPNGTTNSSRNLAPKAPFANGIKIGQVLVTGSSVSGINDILQSDIIQLGTGSGSGSGSGDANEILERLKNRLDSSTFEYVTPNIFSNIGTSLTNTASTNAPFSVVEQAYLFEAINEEYFSLNNLDPEFLNPSSEVDLFDVTEIELSTYYVLGNEDDLADVFVSRDNGTNWQEVQMSRVGLSDTFIGKHSFIPESSFQYSETFGGPKDTNFLFNGSTSISKSFVITSGSTVVNRVDVSAIITGSPIGFLKAKIVKDSAGSPSTSPSDLVTTLQSVNLSGAVSGTLSFITEIPLLKDTTYHVVFETDGEYATNYGLTSGASNITIDSKASTGAIITLKGRILSLLVKIVGKTAGSLFKGYGVFYKKETTFENVNGLLKQEKFTFDGTFENINEFTINFLPDKNLLKVYEVGTGQVYRYGAFTLQGHKVVFPVNTFRKNEIITLVFEQSLGSSFDNSDSNSALLTSNHLGSTDSSIDASHPGRGILIRNAAGVLRELWLDENDNIYVTDPK